jgi:hypothetical protein
MRRTIVAALGVLLCTAGLASAQSLSLEFHDGRVRLKAENVPVSRILAEWTRLGGTKIVNGERVPGAPLTIQLVDVSEQQALEVVLRGAAGYMVLARDTVASGASAFDKILVLPTTTRTPAPAPQAQTPPPTAPPIVPPTSFLERNDPGDVDDEPELQGPPAVPNAFPRGRVPNVNPPPTGVPQQVPQDDDATPPNTSAPMPSTPGNPFGGLRGGARPGTVNPPPPSPAPDPNVRQGGR